MDKVKKMKRISKTAGVIAITSMLLPTAVIAGETVKVDSIDVYSPTSLPTIGLPIKDVPFAVQTATGEEIRQQPGVSIADYMVNNLEGVTVNEVGGNPYQLELNYRGYNATPILGNPQGLSIYVDGVRQNQSFSNNVLWDTIPDFAIDDMQLVGGSNAVFGLNTLGGSLSMQTKSGRTFNKNAIEGSAGSWNRKIALIESGGVSEDNSFDYYVGATNPASEYGVYRVYPHHDNPAFTLVPYAADATVTTSTRTGWTGYLINKKLLGSDTWASALPLSQFNPQLTQNWNQLGGALIGPPIGGGQFGSSISFNMDGDAMAIGSSGQDYTQMYNWNGVVWSQRGTNITGPANSLFGSNVSLDSVGNVVAISGINYTGGFANEGLVRIYETDNTSTSASGLWVQKGGDLTGAAAEYKLGMAVKINQNSDIVVVGAADTTGNGIVRGWLYSGSSWNDMATNIVSGSKAGLSGIDIDGVGTTVICGMADNGYARVFEWESFSAAWNQTGSNIPNDSSLSNITDVAINSNGTIAAVSDITFDSSKGIVKVFEYDAPTTSWSQKGGDIKSTITNEGLGYKIEFNDDGDELIVGASNIVGNYYPRLKHYKWNASASSWDKIRELNESNTHTSYSLSLSRSGTILGAGFNLYTDPNMTGTTLEWSRAGADIFSNSVYNYGSFILGERLGRTVALNYNGTRMIVGAPDYKIDGYTDKAGRVLVYDWNATTSTWSQIGGQTSVSPNGGVGTILNQQNYIGQMVDINGDGTIIISAGSGTISGSPPSYGQVRVHEYSGGNWSIKGTNGLFTGVDVSSVSINKVGNIIAFSDEAWNGVAPNGYKRGKVYIYEWNSGTGVWVSKQILDPYSATNFAHAYKRFGYQISLSDDGFSEMLQTVLDSEDDVKPYFDKDTLH